MRVCTNAEFDNIAYLFYNENQSIFGGLNTPMSGIEYSGVIKTG